MCDSLKSVASALYLLFFYTTVLGLPGSVVGAAAALGLLWDALSDPIIGGLSDRIRSGWARRHAWMAFGSVGMAISFAALFSPPAGLSRPQIFAWLLVSSFLLRTSHSMFTVPYYALGAELSPSYDGRTSIAGYRALSVQIGAMIASGVAVALFFPASTGANSRFAIGSYARMAVTLGALMGAAGMIATIGTWRHRPLSTPASYTDRRGRWKAVAGSRSFVLLAGGAAPFLVAMVLSGVLSIYFLTYYAAIGSGRAVSLCQFALYGGAAVGVVIWMRLAPSHDKHRLYVAACLVTAGLLFAAFWIAAPGRLGDNVRLYVLVLGCFTVGAIASAPAVLAPSMLADVAEEHELLSSDRAEGVFFGMFSASQQLATGLAAALAGPLVDLYAGLVPGSAVQTPTTVARLGAQACVLPGALVLVSALVITRYDLTRRRVTLVQRQLIDRSCAH